MSQDPASCVREAEAGERTFVQKLQKKDPYCTLRGTFAAAVSADGTDPTVAWHCSDCPGLKQLIVKAPDMRGLRNIDGHMKTITHKVHNECENRVRCPHHPTPLHPPRTARPRRPPSAALWR